jgi:hypothetical protein
VATQIFDLPAPASADSAAALSMLQRLVGRRGMLPDEAGALMFEAAMGARPWVTTDRAGLREFVGPQRTLLDAIAVEALAPTDDG